MKNEVTLVQIMIVISVIAVISIVALPNVFNARLTANETAAIRTLKYIYLSQDSFREELEENADNDDSGEFGSFGKLSGAVPTSKGSPADPPYLDERFKITDPNGVVESKGYRFRLFLPDKARKIEERVMNVVDEREGFYCVFAWPTIPGETGARVFFINQVGIAYARQVDKTTVPIETPDPAYSADPFHSDIDINEWMLVR